MSEQVKKWVGTVIKSLPEGLTPGEGLWAYASVEVVDSSGDIVRVGGIDYSGFHSPDNGQHMKILASHLKVLPDGTPPVVGRVEKFEKTVTPDGQPALAFFMTWAKDGQGATTPLAKTYKDLYDGGYLDSFSIGASVGARKVIKETGGYDYTKTYLSEVSCVTIPANQRATVIRAMMGDELDFGAVLAAVEGVAEQVEKLSAPNNFDHMVEGLAKSFAESLDQKLNPLIERLDYLESCIVTKSEASPATGDRNGERLSKELQTFRQQLQKFVQNM